MSNELLHKITSLMGSRICHDLISPIGAISNGVELLTMTNPSSGPEIDLISESVNNANARVKFFRIALGIASEGQQSSSKEMVSICNDISSERIKIIWNPTEDISRSEVKLACLLILCAEISLPRGGSVTTDYLDGKWHVTAQGDLSTSNANLFEKLTQPINPDGITASEIQFLLAPLQACELGRAIEYKSENNTLSIIC